ncbi:Elicitin [Phytophthora megakarya]|uniref:Elicitin n=1 Tax=Phytophthora megakarya TaxID=4795 RepID=A0A225WXG8_9STRA|nr:Elicitin [Phytophthora megakarya]
MQISLTAFFLGLLALLSTTTNAALCNPFELTMAMIPLYVNPAYPVCSKDVGVQLPFMAPPTPTQIAAMCASDACKSLIKLALRLNLPDCEVVVDGVAYNVLLVRARRAQQCFSESQTSNINPIVALSEAPIVRTSSCLAMEPAATKPVDNQDIAAVAAAKLSERKRLKHREYVKKSYKKKLSGKKSETSLTTNEKPTTRHMQKYLQATELKKWYQHENDRLYQLNAYHMKVESRMGQLLDASEAAKVPLPGVPLAHQYHIHPLPSTTYTKVINDATNDVLRFARSPEKLSTGARVLGWTDQREVHGRTLKFALQKEFNLSPRDLLQRSWSIFSDPEEFPKVYGSALDVQFHVLQHVDPDTILFFRHIAPPADSTRVVKTVFLLARRQFEEGYLLLLKSIDKDLVHFEEVDGSGIPEVRVDPNAALKLVSSEMWVDKYIWVLFYTIPKEPKQCLFHFGGATSTTLWLREVLFVALRWETMAVGSQFTLTAE